MTTLVPEDQIEKIVGVRRQKKRHIGRAVSSEQQVYIMHSQECREHEDLLWCDYSLALYAGGIMSPGNREAWEKALDRPVELVIINELIYPVTQLSVLPEDFLDAETET